MPSVRYLNIENTANKKADDVEKTANDKADKILKEAEEKSKIK